MAAYTGNGLNGSTAMATRPTSPYVPLRQAMDRLFQESILAPSLVDQFWSGWPSAGRIPAAAAGANLWETSESYVVQMALPGMKPDSIDCTVEQNVLTCKGETAVTAPENATAIWQGLGGSAAYRILLPAEVESGHAQATYQDGVLTITLPKAIRARTHSIKVTAK